jgi:hypothetical protein
MKAWLVHRPCKHSQVSRSGCPAGPMAEHSGATLLGLGVGRIAMPPLAIDLGRL